MRRTQNKRLEAASASGVHKIELSQAHPGLRLAIALLALLLGAGTITYAVMGALGRQAGWNEITAQGNDMSCAGDFSFFYELGRGETSASAEYKALTGLYTRLTVDAYRLFSRTESVEGLYNLYYVNKNPNTDIPVEPALYHALDLLAREGGTALYLAPLYEEYRGLFAAGTAEEAALFDPRLDEAEAAYFAEVLEFVNEGAVKLEFPGPDTVRLSVSDEYLAYAAAHEITDFLDFGLYANAVIADYLAEGLRDAGYTRGYLTSRDGFSCILGEVEYSISVVRRRGNTVSLAGTAATPTARSLITLRDFPLSAAEDWYFDLGGGQFRTPYVNLSDGLCQAGTDLMIAWSGEESCAALLLAVLPVYAADALDTEAVKTLAASGVFALYGDGDAICCTGADAVFQPAEGTAFTFCYE